MIKLENRRWLITNCHFCNAEIARRKDKHRTKRYCGLTCRNAEARGIILTDEFRDEVERLKKDEAWSYREIAEFFGCNYQLIYGIIKGKV